MSARQAPSSGGRGARYLRVGCYVVGGLASAVLVATLVLLAIHGHFFGLALPAVGALIPVLLRYIAYRLGVPRPASSRERLEKILMSAGFRPAPSAWAAWKARARSYRLAKDPVAAAAQATAFNLAAEYGPGVEAEVESALRARQSQQQPEQYFDPISLGGLIVSIASLAWATYASLRSQTPHPAPDVVARNVRIQLKAHDAEAPASQGKLTEIVVAEIIRAADIAG